MSSTFLEIIISVIDLVLLVSCLYNGHVYGKYINGSEIMTIDTIGPIKCGQQCLSINGCLAYNYDRDMLHCRPLADNSSTGTLVESEKTRYKDRQNIPPDIHGLCINADCPKFSQCVKLSSGKHTCARILCDDPPPSYVNKEAAASLKRFSVGTTFQYQCVVSGDIVTNNMTCKANGKWTSVNQQCQCGSPSQPFDGTPVCSYLGCEARFRCNWNEIVQGDSRMVCGNSSTWITLGDYSCVPSGCGNPPAPITNSYKSSVTCSSTLKECKVYYLCNPDYRLLNYVTVSTCSLSGPVKSWTNPGQVCHYECAANRPAVDHSSLSDPTCTTTCTYICDNGYTMVGQPNRNCIVEYGWDSGPTACIINSNG